METVELKIGKPYYIWYFNHVDGRPNYMGLYYYVGCGKFSENLSPLFWMYPFPADIAVPIDNGKVRSVLFTSEIRIEDGLNLNDYVIKDRKLKDVESAHLNDLDWWNDFVKKFSLRND